MEEDMGFDPAMPEDAGAPEEGVNVRHQPPSAFDLRRYPAAGPACHAVRGLLRAYADQEASLGEREQVDEHVHTCRDCAVALSRVEAEVYRLRQAFAPTSEVPADFVRKVMIRVRAENAGEARRHVEGTRVSSDFTPRVMERIRREWKRPSVAERLGVGVRRHGLIMLAAAAAAAFVLWLRLAAPTVDTGLQVLAAEGGTLARADRSVALQPGDELHAGDRVVLAAERAHAAFLVARSDAAAERASLELDAGGALTVLANARSARAPLFRLDVGSLSVRVSSAERVAFTLAGETTVSLEPGTFSVFVYPVERHDGELAHEAFHAVRLAALEGRATVQRGIGAPFTVEAGSAALFDGWSSVTMERIPTDAEITASWGRRDLAVEQMTVDPAPTLDDWLGRVINGQTNAGVAGATVRVQRVGQDPRLVFTAEDGTFRLEKFGEVEGDVALVDVTLPEGGTAAARLASVANYSGPMTMRSAGLGPRRERRLDPIRLSPERQVMGTVYDADRRPVIGARVTPVLLDALSGAAKRMTSVVASAVTGADGRFSLWRLPASLPAHTDVVLLIEHAQHGPVAALDLLADPSLRDQAISVVMARRERVTLTDLPAGQVVEVLASIRNLAASTMLDVSSVLVAASGVAEIDVAEGASLWLRGTQGLVALAPNRDRPGTLAQVDDPAPPRVAALAASATMRASGVIEQGRWRYDDLYTGGSERRRVALMDRDGHDLAGAHLFVASKADGSLAYLGEMTSPQADWMLPSTSDYRVVAVSDDGSVGVVDANELQEDMLRVRVLSPGSARLPQDVLDQVRATSDLRNGFAVFELQMVEPLRDYVVYRHVGRESGWELHGLIPGTYRLVTTEGSSWLVRVPPGARGEFVRD